MRILTKSIQGTNIHLWNRSQVLDYESRHWSDGLTLSEWMDDSVEINISGTTRNIFKVGYYNPPGSGPAGEALYTDDNFGLFETDNIINFSVNFEFVGDDGTVFGTYQHTQDTTTKHVICACRVV